ncbi:two-component system, response regulator YesN [Paenibacillus sp. UNCCL117]|uniref:response regulator n=1 Tax=unclassified Paenibacillus TaxID=185978 RepID=UPI00088047F4|nr:MULTISPECIES: response regulator [unclassified Paenibacillus]SDE19693.1 two-component system, response regulator YesN [Paenibacillus sp. cl123]SFW61955.1 two-component system, response regulator YesN [Paenibacillus sp. UNCCL117]
MLGQDKITVCVIDDIRSVVDGLTAIDWASEGIEVAGTASNGEDGLELVARVKPDIVITDIRMPRMDGLTMLRKLLELSHACKVILISSYTDFDYAKQAVQLGAFDYVVKPFTEEDIVEAVRKAMLQIKQEQAELLNIQGMEIKLRESMPLLRQEYMSLLVHHRTPWEQASQRWAFLKMDIDPHDLIVMLLEIDGFHERVAELSIHEIELIRFSLQNIAEETIRQHARCVFFRSKENRFVAILNVPAELTATRIAENCCRNIEAFTKFTVSVGVGGRAESVAELPDSYRQADRALAYHLFTEGNGAIGYDELPRSDKQSPVALEGKEEVLLALRAGNGERAAELLMQMSAELHKQEPRPHPDYLLSHFEELAASIIRTLYELVALGELQPLIQAYKEAVGGSGAATSGLEHMLAALCREGGELVRRNTLSEGQRIIYKSLEYVSGRLEQDLTVGECAASVHLSVSYYSSLFKKVMGMTLTQYVTSERMQKAKSLLIGGMPVQDVAAAVGYEERRYFSETFKRTTGMTPSEFRESYHPEA